MTITAAVGGDGRLLASLLSLEGASSDEVGPSPRISPPAAATFVSTGAKPDLESGADV